MRSLHTHNSAHTSAGHTHTHMKAHTSWNLGEFGVTLSGDIANSQAAHDLALLHEAQRQTEVDITLGIAKRVPGKKAGKTKIERDGRKRSDVPYSAAIGERLATLFASMTSEALGLTNVECTVGVKSVETKEKKYQRAIAKLTQRESLPDFETWLADKVGFEGKTHDENGEYTQDVIVAVDAFIQEALANM